jgi:tRNA (guanosine-2'-O-)-methyltransferase
MKDFFISEEEKQELRMKWYKAIVRRSDLIEEAYYSSKES